MACGLTWQKVFGAVLLGILLSYIHFGISGVGTDLVQYLVSE